LQPQQEAALKVSDAAGHALLRYCTLQQRSVVRSRCL
jgi:hypothetical protein